MLVPVLENLNNTVRRISFEARHDLNTQSRSAGCASVAEANPDSAGSDADRVGLEGDAGGSGPRFAAADVETALVFQAFDDGVDDDAVGQLDLLVGAEAVGGIKRALQRPIDRIGLRPAVETDHVLLVDLLDGALDVAIALPTRRIANPAHRRGGGGRHGGGAARAGCRHPADPGALRNLRLRERLIRGSQVRVLSGMPRPLLSDPERQGADCF